MKCSTCGNELTLLFTSSACDWCDGKRVAAPPDTHVGFVVWRGFLGPGFPHYVFANEESAFRWMRGQGSASGVVKRVLATEPFKWRDRGGVLTGLRFAAHLYEVFQDRLFVQAPHRAWLAPEQS